MNYSGRSLHWQHEEMKMILPAPVLRSFIKKDVVNSTLKEVVASLAIGCLLAGAVWALFI